MPPTESLVFPFLLTLFAGLATGIGSVLAFFVPRTNFRFLSLALAFSAGAMLFVSFAEILPKGLTALTDALGDRNGTVWAYVAFFVGMIVSALIDVLVPKAENPHEPREGAELDTVREDARRRPALLRVGLVTALAISLHNFPEGMATFLAALEDTKLGLAIAVAVAIHNIPEGISVSVPIYYATGSRRKAFGWSLLSGLAEPVGAVVGYWLLSEFLNTTVRGALFAAVAGIMVFISLDELLPSAKRYSKGHEPVYGMLGGMAVMALSLILMK